MSLLKKYILDVIQHQFSYKNKIKKKNIRPTVHYFFQHVKVNTHVFLPDRIG